MTGELWERQKGESSKSFSWFKIYRDLGPTRTHQNVIDYLEETTLDVTNGHPNQKLIPIPTLNALKKQSERWHWVKRCRAYDNYQDQLEIEANNEAYKKSSERLIGIGNQLMDIMESNIDELEVDLEGKTTSKSHSIKSVADAFDKTTKNIRLLYGKSTDIKDENVTADVGVDADVNHRGDTTQKIIMNPKYAELTKEILDDLVKDDNKE